MIRVNLPRIMQGVVALGNVAKNQPVQVAGLMAKVATVSNSPASLAKNQDAQINQPRKRQAPQPTAEMIRQAIERSFKEGVASGALKMPDVVDGQAQRAPLQTMTVDLSPVKLASDIFLRQDSELKLSAKGESLAASLQNAMRERNAAQQKTEPTAAQNEKSEQKPLSQMGSLESGLLRAVREREQRLQQGSVAGRE